MGALLLGGCLFLSGCLLPDSPTPPHTTVVGHVELDDSDDCRDTQVLLGDQVVSVQPDGSFSLETDAEGPMVVALAVDGSVLMLSIANIERGSQAVMTKQRNALIQVSISPQTTAETLVFLHPGIFTSDPEAVQEILEILGDSAEVRSLGAYIASSIALGEEAEPSESLYAAAVSGAVSAINARYTESGGPRSFSHSSLETHSMEAPACFPTDLVRVQVSAGGSTLRGDSYEIPVSVVPSEAASWLVVANEVSPGQFASQDALRQLTSLDPIEWMPDGYVDVIQVDGESLFRYVDVIGLAINTALEWLVGQCGWESSEGVLEIPADRPGLYSMRAMSGGIADLAEFAILPELHAVGDPDSRLSPGAGQWVTGLTLNCMTVALDLVSCLVNLSDFEPAVRSATSGMLSATANTVQDEILSDGDTFRTLFIGTLTAGVKTLLTAAGKQATSMLLRTVLQWFNIASQVMTLISNGGEAAHILANLLFTDSPLECCLLGVDLDQLAFAGNGSDEIVVIPDSYLESAIRKAIVKPSGPILASDLAGLLELWVSRAPVGQQIADLTGLEYCATLEVLSLGGQDIANLAPLRNLRHLRTIALSENRVSDLSPIAGLGALEMLEMDRNRIETLPPMSELVSLKHLLIGQNAIRDLAPLAGLRSIESLDLRSNPASDLRPLAYLTTLHVLFLYDMDITNVAPLCSLSRLEELYLSGNPISDWSCLLELPALRVLDIAASP